MHTVTIGRRLMLKLQSVPSHAPCKPVSDAPDTDLPHLILDGFLRREDLAQQLGLSPRTIDRWEALRKGPPRVCIGRTILYNVESVREWLRSNERQPTVRRRVVGQNRRRSLAAVRRPEHSDRSLARPCN